MKELNIQQIVKEILEDNRMTRESDDLLIYHFYLKLNSKLNSLSISYFFQQLANREMPSMRSIERARRELQKNNTHLQGDNYEHRQAHSEEIRYTISSSPSQAIMKLS